MSKQQIRNALLLLLTATIWGVAFVAQRVGMDYVGPFTFTSVRSLVGAVSLLPVIALMNKRRAAQAQSDAPVAPQTKAQTRTLLLGGVLCGIILCAGTSLQQIALQQASVGKAGFITALYIVIVPVIGHFMGKRSGGLTWVGVLVALVGLYFLCMKEALSVESVDVLLFVGALIFALHILVIDYFTHRVDGLKMSCIQLFVCSLISAVPMFALEKPEMGAIFSAWLPILYAGALSSGAGYTLQIIAQRGMNPTVASLILSLESVMSVLAGWILLGQHLSARELLGCALMFAAILLAQLPVERFARKKIEKKESEHAWYHSG